MFPPALDDIPTEKLEAEVANLYSQISAQTCRWLLLVAELDRREAHLNWGCRSLAHWLSWQCGLALRAAREHVRVARRLEDLPEIRECFSRGELSYSKVRALSRVADAETEADLLEIARNSTGAQLESIARAYRRAMPESDRKEIADRRYARLNWDEDGSLVVSARLSPEEGALFIKAFEQAREELFRERDPQPGARAASEETETGAARVSSADALVRVAERAQLAADGPVSGGDAHQVVLHLDVAALSGTEVGIGQRCELEKGPGLALETARRLSCDASVLAIAEQDGEPLSIGRKTRTIPPAIRRAIRVRDQGCRFPGCSANRFVDAHHIVHWARGGETSLENLVSLCRHHHRLLHEGGFTVEARSGGVLVFRRPNGAELPTSVPLPGVGRQGPSVIDPPPLSRRDSLIQRLGPVAPREGYQRLDRDLTMLALLHGSREPRGPDPLSVG